MDSMMSSPVAQIGMPLAAGYAGAASPGGARGVAAGLNTSEYMMERAADQRVRDLFAGDPPSDEMGNNIIAAGARPTPKHIDRIAEVMDLAKKTVSQGGLQALPTGISAMTRLADFATKYEQPVEVDGSLMSRTGEVLGSAPVRAPFAVQGGNVLNKVTGAAGAAPLQSAQLQEKSRVNEARIADLEGRRNVNDARVSQVKSQADLYLERAKKVRAETDLLIKELEEGRYAGKNLTVEQRMKILSDMITDSGLEEYQRKRLLQLHDELTGAVKPAESTEEGASDPDSVAAKMMPAHQAGATALGASPTGQVYVYDPKLGGTRPQ